MRMKRTKANHQEKRMKRMFLIAKVFLCMTPIIAYVYVSLQAMMLQVSLQDCMQTSPNLAIVFLIAMMNPYIAYLLYLMEKKLEKGEQTFALINMLLLLITQLLTMNVFYFMMLAYVFYKAYCFYSLDFSKLTSYLHLKTLFYQGGGSMLMVMLSSICFYATMQII